MKRWGPARWVGWGLLVLIVVGVRGGAVGAGPERVYFAATGHFVEGKFLSYWREHGGLAIFGYPLTPAFPEGGYMVQYFERNRFELHPENAGSVYEVLLGHLGRDSLRAEGRSVPPPGPQRAGEGERYFPETGYKAGGAFLRYWGEHGGLAQFGYPITPEMKDGSNGLTVQYFERARFELHPENAGTPYYVLLGLLGRDKSERLDPTLRDRWAERPLSERVDVSLSGHVGVLTLGTVKSDISLQLRILDGKNRVQAVRGLAPGVETEILAGGAPGPHSLLFYEDGLVVGAQWGAFTLDVPQVGIRTGDPVWDGLYPRVKGYLENDAVTYYSPVDERPVHGYRSPDTAFLWLRDHVYQSKGFKYFEPDMKGALDYFRGTQRADGSFDDYFLHYPGLETYKDQIEIEADREYLFVEGVWTAWQATGDDEWLRANLAAMERGLTHTFTDPRRWSSEMGLVKRGFTIDTWDFEQGSEGNNIRRRIDADTKWGIMHGDNTGAYHAARLLAGMERYFGRGEEGRAWDERADRLLRNLNRVSWNGQFYTHQVHITPVQPVGVDESTQLSLSNAYALNRGTLSQEQAAALIRTYQQRRAANGSRIFAEWYSIDPPFPAGFGPPGEYVNGGVMPLVGGELARGAFEYGFEEYGLDILRRYWALLERTGGSYLWYYPDGRPGIKAEGGTLPTDGWGSSAMLSALTEGLAGVVDEGKLYREVELSPRWEAAEVGSAEVTLGYGASGAYFAYRWERRADGRISLTWGGEQTQGVRLHLLLPVGAPAPKGVVVDGVAVPFEVTRVESSLYLNVMLAGSGHVDIR